MSVDVDSDWIGAAAAVDDDDEARSELALTGADDDVALLFDVDDPSLP